MLGQHGRDPFELLAVADMALYQAKGAGRDQVRMCAHAAGQAATSQVITSQVITSRATTSEHADEATNPCP